MSGGMRFDGDDIRRMPLPMQEQLGAALVAQLMQAPPVAAKQKVNKRFVRRLVFANDRAARRYRILRKQEESGAITELLAYKDPLRGIYRFTYTVTEEF